MRTKNLISFAFTLFVTLLLFTLLYVFVTETASLKPAASFDTDSMTVMSNSGINTEGKLDLIVSNAMILSSTDTSIRYSFTIKNNSIDTIASLENVSIQNFYSADTDIDDARDVDAGLSNLDIKSSLAPGESYTGTCFASGKIPKGMKYLVFIVDAADALDEADEANNTYVLSLRPDLVFADAQITSTSDKKISYTYTIKNNGCLPVTDLYNISIQNLYSANNTYNDKGDMPAGGSILGAKRSLAPGESFTGTFYSFNTVPAGMNNMLLKIDSCNIEEEADETNNTYAIELMADLQITDIEVISKTPTQVTYTYKIKNNGIKIIPSIFNVSIQHFYSANDVFNDAGDVSAGGGILGINCSLAPGESYSGTFSAFGTVPDGMSYLTGMIDWGDNLKETNEENNKFSTLIPYK